MTERHAPTRDEVERLGIWMTVEDAAWLWGCSRAQMYADIDARRVPFPVVRVGRKLRIPTAPMLELLGVEPNQTPNSAEARGRTAPQQSHPEVKDDGKDQSTRRFRAV